ncbi:uncharacterized protein F4822DRAFT_387102 [Hypoxylon trugodes]|uniref:uncharacterized protein n=1 Tax=Hypoxylon trugodes TaxID=326681 RepID=UPI002193601D|nr:uncharacterized protein F4822DRAFT_387102 [Hypoxylon trugodes]KAI1394115.1 hypothetical protein F4822DRAFT_387102 [Hypoxylon trugodes]
MPPLLPVPSKAAIHALRGLALGTSCAIGVILEDRRRRINTLRTAVSNKEKLKSAKQYHGTANAAAFQVDDAIFTEWDELHIQPRDRRAPFYDDYPALEKHLRRKKSEESLGARHTAPLKFEDASESSVPTSTHTQLSPPPLPIVQRNTTLPNSSARLVSPPQIKPDDTKIDAHKVWQEGDATISESYPKNPEAFISSITSILANEGGMNLDQALERFLYGCNSLYSFKSFDDDWIAVSAQLSRICQKRKRWEDANKVLATTISAGPLDESQYWAHNPMSIVNYFMRQTDANGYRSPHAVAAATHLYLPTFKEKPRLYNQDWDFIGRHLFTQNLKKRKHNAAHSIYWRIVASHQADPAHFTGWAIQQLYEHSDHKHVVKYFILNFSKMEPGNQNIQKTVDCVIHAVEHLKGHKAESVLDALQEMHLPRDHLRSAWIFRLLQACWRRDQDFPKLKAVHEKIVSRETLLKIGHPQSIYRAMMEISIKAGENDIARTYYEECIQKYPEMAKDVASKGFIALSFAKAGDWDGVLAAFIEMQTSRDGQENQYDNAFIMVLREFAESHSAVEVRDFVSKYISVLGVRMHRYIVTVVAKKYGDCHDMSGFMSWLTYCADTGFALDAGICNVLLHNCSKWGLSYTELRGLHSKISKMSPGLTDDVTQRIMNQAASTTGSIRIPSRSPHSRVSTVKKLSFTGRITSKRDVFEAMNKELNEGMPWPAFQIYNRAVRLGMPFCPRCLSLAVLASLRHPSHSSKHAMNLIRSAHERGDDVNQAVTTYIKYELSNINVDVKENVLLRMRNLISRFESSRIIIQPEAMTHMAMVCAEMDYSGKAVALCQLAMDKKGTKNQCFSRLSTRALLRAYARIRDVGAMRDLIRDLFASGYSTDTSVLSYLKSARRIVQKYENDKAADTIRGILEEATARMVRKRAEQRKEGKKMAAETLTIMRNALADMKINETAVPLENDATTEEQTKQQVGRDVLPLVAVLG